MIYKLSKEQYDRVLNVFQKGAPLNTLITPEELHDFAWNYSWGDGYSKLKWVINSPLCSKGTALLLYWYSQPAYFSQLDKSEISKYQWDAFDFIQELQQKYLNGDFTLHKVAFDPRNDESIDWIEESEIEKSNKPHNIPEKMLEPVKGIIIERGSY